MQSLIQHSIQPHLKNGAAGNLQDTAEIFDPSSYRSVHNLATNTDRRPFEDLLKKTAEAIFMAKCLKFNGFFGNQDVVKEEATKAEIFISSLLLRHLQIASTNGLQMAECILKNNDITKFDILPVGGAIFPTMSFFNHNCYPNSLRLGYENHQVIRVIRKIAPGEELTIDYGFDFYANPIEKRQKRAKTQYYFQCECIACVENWPTYEGLNNKIRQFKAEITHEIADNIEWQLQRYHMAMDHLMRLDIAKAAPLFREYLMVMNDIIAHPDQRYIDCEEAFKQCLWLENRGYKPKISGGERSRQTSVVSFQMSPR